jgi:hypothetical protein
LDERGQQLLATDDAVDDQADDDGQIRQQGRGRQTLLERLFRVRDNAEFSANLVAGRGGSGVERRRDRWKIVRRGGQRGRGDLGRRAFRRLGEACGAPQVEFLLLAASRFGAVVPLAPLALRLSSRVVTATEGAEKIFPLGVAGGGQETDVAVSAVDSAQRTIRVCLQDGVDRRLILTDKRKATIGLVPIGTEFEDFAQRKTSRVKSSVMFESC